MGGGPPWRIPRSHRVGTKCPNSSEQSWIVLYNIRPWAVSFPTEQPIEQVDHFHSLLRSESEAVHRQDRLPPVVPYALERSELPLPGIRRCHGPAYLVVLRDPVLRGYEIDLRIPERPGSHDVSAPLQLYEHHVLHRSADVGASCTPERRIADAQVRGVVLPVGLHQLLPDDVVSFHMMEQHAFDQPLDVSVRRRRIQSRAFRYRRIVGGVPDVGEQEPRHAGQFPDAPQLLPLQNVLDQDGVEDALQVVVAVLLPSGRVYTRERTESQEHPEALLDVIRWVQLQILLER